MGSFPLVGNSIGWIVIENLSFRQNYFTTLYIELDAASLVLTGYVFEGWVGQKNSLKLSWDLCQASLKISISLAVIEIRSCKHENLTTLI